MQNISLLCSEDQMQFIQKMTNATREEVIYTIRIAGISVEEIIRSLRKSAREKMPFSR